MTMQDETEVPAGIEYSELPPDEQESEAQPPAPQPSAREVELERRLRAQGNDLAAMRRTNQTLAGHLTNMNERVEQLTAGFTQQQKTAEEDRQRQVQAYLESLPADQRVREELRLTQERVNRLESRQAAPQARPSAPQQQQENPQQYQARRSREILQDAADTFNVPITPDDIQNIPAEAWEDENEFRRAVSRMAGQKANKPRPAANEEDQDVAKAKSNGKNEDMAENVKQRVLRDLGVSSPASPRAAASRKGTAPTGDDIRKSVQTYDSKSGPKANVAKLKAMRDKLPQG